MVSIAGESGIRKTPRRRAFWRWTSILLLLAIVVAALGYYRPWPKPPIGPIVASDDSQGQWPLYGQNSGGDRFSQLTQINRGNVRALDVAWTYSTGEYARLGAENAAKFYAFQTTPILFAGSLIGCTHSHEVFAIDPGTGVQKWRYDPELTPTPRGATQLKCRGVTAWTDPQLPADAPCKDRIVYAASLQVTELDAHDGRPCGAFGVGGKVDVVVSDAEFKDEVELRSPPVIVDDVVVFGSSFVDIYRTNAPSGKLRAFDLRTGALRWEYDPVPRDRANPAYASWGRGSADYTGSTNAWSFLSADPVNKLIFMPATSPSADFYGAERPGDNRWANSLIAIDATTGKQVWAYQLTHHDLWDSDLPAMPMLVDINRNGRKIPAVVQLTKQGFVYVFNRLTGVPVYPIVERPVSRYTDVPGEWISPTQPHATGIPPLTRQGLKPGDAWGFTPVDKAACRRRIAAYRNDGLFSPPTRQGTILMPSGAGGMNWGGGAIDPRTGILYVPNMQMPAVVKLVPRGGKIDPRRPGAGAEEQPFPMKGTPYIGDLSFLVSPVGAPCSPPPWATLSAVDLGTGEVKWKVPLGSIENLSRLAPPLMLGAPFSGGPIVTAGGITFMAGGTDRKFRAFDTATGAILWTARLPAGGMAVPMTYSWQGKQYVVIAAGGNNLFPGPMGDSVVAFALKPGWRW